MASPFLYPKTLHSRTETPSVFKTYRTYKKYLKKEFNGACIYCLIHDRIKNYSEFSVEHYRPVKLFPHLKYEYLNLYYACTACNRRKGATWPTKTQEKNKIFIPNPCEHRMFDHLQYKGDTVVSKTKAGEWTIEVLGLNDNEDVEYRRFMLDMIGEINEKVARVEKTIDIMNKKLKACKKMNRAGIQNNITTHMGKLTSLKRNLTKLMN